MSTEFDKDEYSFAYPDGIQNNYWNVARNKTILHFINKFQLNNILDVGCGRGIVTTALFQNNLSIQGVELGTTVPISNSGVPILYNTDATTLPIDQHKTFKTITLFDVIEHIEQPVSFIKKLAGHYKDVETLVITVPARKELWTNFDEYYGHYRRYTINDLEKEITESGFTIKYCGYFFHSLYFLIRLSNLISKKRELSFKSPSGFSLFIHKLFGTLLFIENMILPKSWLGSSVICIAEKKK